MCRVNAIWIVSVNTVQEMQLCVNSEESCNQRNISVKRAVIREIYLILMEIIFLYAEHKYISLDAVKMFEFTVTWQDRCSSVITRREIARGLGPERAGE